MAVKLCGSTAPQLLQPALFLRNFWVSPHGSPMDIQAICCCLVSKLCLTLLRTPGLYPARLLRPGISQERILEWVAISFSRRSSWLRDWTSSPALVHGFFATEPPGKPPHTNCRITVYPSLCLWDSCVIVSLFPCGNKKITLHSVRIFFYLFFSYPWYD